MQPVIPARHYGAHLEMQPIPQSIDDDGLSMSEWRLSEDDRHRLMCGGRIRLWVYTNDYSRPIVVEAMEPDKCVIHES